MVISNVPVVSERDTIIKIKIRLDAVHPQERKYEKFFAPSGYTTISQGNFVLELRALWIGIGTEIGIEIEIDFWQCSDFDSDFDIDFDELCPTLGVPCEQHPT
jgi:hypothetical protein